MGRLRAFGFSSDGNWVYGAVRVWRGYKSVGSEEGYALRNNGEIDEDANTDTWHDHPLPHFLPPRSTPSPPLRQNLKGSTPPLWEGISGRERSSIEEPSIFRGEEKTFYSRTQQPGPRQGHQRKELEQECVWERERSGALPWTRSRERAKVSR